MKLLSLAFLLIPPFAPGWQSEMTVQVVRVIDGDSIIVRSRNRSFSLRISPIDAPEIAQTCQGKQGTIHIGEVSKAVLTSLISSKLKIEILGTDLYGRTLVKIPQALQLVELGWAIPYQRAYFSSVAEKQKYYSAFYRAFRERKGMWECKKLMNPLFYRKKFKSKLK